MSFQGLQVEDLCHGANDWRNIQEVVRAAFKTLYDVVVSQQERIAVLEQLLDTKASMADTNERMTVLEQRLDTKASIADTNEALHTKANKESVAAALHRKANKSELQEKADRAETIQALNTKADQADTAAALNRKADKADVQSALQTKADRADTIQALETKADHAEVLRALDNKSDIDEVRAAIELKADITQVNEALARKANIVEVNKALEFKAEIQEVRRKAEQTAVEELARQVALRANVADVCTLLDSKAGVEDVNNALIELNKELDNKAPLEDFNKIIADQRLINESLVAEQCVARWIWKSGKTKTGHGVPWNVQSVNTNPDNFLWEKDKVHIVVNAPGLYELSFGFFARKKPSVQLLINGEPVLSAINTASYVIHHSSGRLTSVGSHPSGSVTGLTLVDFLALPQRARIAISYNGEEGAEGFLGLRKL
eukprot:TRINITY_DN750_c0_g2_i1.p1 TRINITY_DN750_c0_g2~~TRINITY_DN750_c0_g2_i1.p1  ORF type:complete len:432 (-),score=120.43 TRINITY_DN750_c0_g2_i1:55-1350(-)